MKEGEEEGELLGIRLLFRQLKHPKKNSKRGSVYVRKLRSSMYFCFESLTLDRLYPVKGIKRRERVYEGKCPIDQVYVFQANGETRPRRAWSGSHVRGRRDRSAKYEDCVRDNDLSCPGHSCQSLSGYFQNGGRTLVGSVKIYLSNFPYQR